MEIAPNLRVILVHGTWGRGLFSMSPKLNPGRKLRWFEAGSTFRTALEKELSTHRLNASIETFLWSGENSIKVRAEAATKLAAEINEYAGNFPQTRQVILAHSHGGTVAMLCAHRLDPCIRPMVVTMATPFMEAVPLRATQNYLLSLGVTYYVFQVVFDLAVFLPLAILAAHSFSRLGHRSFAEMVGLYFVNLIALLACFFAREAGRHVFSYLIGNLRPPLGRADRASELRKLSKGGMTLPPSTHLLILRGIDDEASLALAGSALSQRLDRLALGLLFRILFFLLFVLVAASYSASFLPDFVWEMFSNTLLGPTVIYFLLAVLGSSCLEASAEAFTVRSSRLVPFDAK